MLLNISPTLRLASVALTSLMTVASAPIAPLNADTRILSCVHVRIPGSMYAGPNGEHPPTASEGEKLAISIDTSDCDQSIVQLATPWTMHLGNTNYKSAKAVVVAHLLVPGTTQYMWEVHSPFPQEYQHAQAFVSTAHPQYYIQVQTASNDGRELLVGQSEPFAIIADTHTQQQQDPEHSDTPSSHVSIPRDSTQPDLPHLKKREENNSDKTDAQAILSSDPIAALSDPVVSDVKEDEKEASSSETAAAKSDAEIAAAVVLKPKPKPPVEEEKPDSEDTPKTHYPNIPKDTTVPDPSTIPKVSGPNLHSPEDPVPYVPPEVGKAIPPKKSAEETFLKYVGAGAAIFSTVGLGLGGVVGGFLGGTVGFVIGLIGAAANGAFSN
ncbi:hypothetical protein BG005_007685 [Podila minutissima]|nr:hypothetical protein BG005_007685 [Podila minutissima]